MNIGICGTGTIASWVSDILNQLGDEKIVLYACATSPGFDCGEFARQYGWQKVCATFEELMADEKVDLVYIAVPNTMHHSLCRMALEAGKPVLVEKPFAVNDTEAEELIALAHRKGLFLSEALWPCFLPVYQKIREELAAETIGELVCGEIIMLDNVLFLPRVRSLELGGGSLLDGGSYTLGFMTSFFGTEYEKVEAKVRKFETGVDAEDDFTVTYPGGKQVHIRQTMDMPREKHREYAELVGTKGKIWVDCVSNPRVCQVLELDGSLRREIPVEPQIHFRGMPPVSGYEHEFMAYEQALREGATQCAQATHTQTLAIARLMTEIRRQGGIRFPFEQQ